MSSRLPHGDGDAVANLFHLSYVLRIKEITCIIREALVTIQQSLYEILFNCQCNKSVTGEATGTIWKLAGECMTSAFVSSIKSSGVCPSAGATHSSFAAYCGSDGCRHVLNLRPRTFLMTASV